MKSVWCSALAAALAAVVVLFPAPAGGSPQAAFREDARHLPGARAWPPHPRSIVNLSSRNVGSTSLFPQQLFSTLAVPADRWLVVTHASMPADLSLVEASGGTFTFKRPGGPASGLLGNRHDPGAPLGWTFAPGSQVVLRNDGTQSVPLDFQIVGYLAEP